jgi:hypothetical protein
MISTLESDIDVMMSDWGVTVVFGSQSCMGILDQPQRDAVMASIGSVNMTDYSLTYRTTALNPQPNSKDTITVDGVGYIVRDSSGLDDGNMTKLMLKTK